MAKSNKNISEAQDTFLKEIKRDNKLVFIFQILILIGLIALWEVCAHFNIIDAFIFSSPSRVLKSFLEMLYTGELLIHTGFTLYETLLGFLIGSILGIIIAIILWGNQMLNRIFEPYLVILNALPKTALAPILVVWLGNNLKSVIVVAVSLTIVVTIISTINCFNEIEEEKIKLIYALGGTKRDMLRKLILPYSITTIVSTLKVNIGLSLIGVIIGEIIGSKYGLGYLIIYGSQVFKMDWVMMSIIILLILAGLLYKTITIIEKRLVRWKQ